MLKKLTGKNPHEYKFAAKHLMDNADTALFSELVENDSFLFDFVKQNVANRLFEATNDDNWKSVLEFMKFYSPSYEDFITSTLAKYADEDLTDKMLEILSQGTEDEKTYAARFFSYVQDPLAIDLLREHAYSDNENLSANCAATLALMNDENSYNDAIEKLKSDDEFEKLSAVRFLTAYGRKDALSFLIEAMKSSAFSENIAGEIPYLVNILDILDSDFENGLLVVNSIINGLGEILSLSSVFDFELFEVFEVLKKYLDDSRCAVVLLNAYEKFNTLTENDEYLFDEDKNTKNEVQDIKKLLTGINKKELFNKADKELNCSSPFVFTALDFAEDLNAIRELLKCNNQTVILKTLEVLKNKNNLDETAKTVALLKVTDDNIKKIIRAI